MEIQTLDKKSIMSEEVFTELFDQEDSILRARMFLELSDRAGELGCKTAFEKLYRQYEKVAKEREKKRLLEEKSTQLVDHWALFDDPYGRVKCGNWIYDPVKGMIFSQSTSRCDIVVCYHPILPVERLRNLQTGEEQVKIAFKRNGYWTEITVPKSLISSASKITALASRGVAVTSENAKFLVQYLSDVENLNEDYIKVSYSSSKLGWVNGSFLPYDDEIIFDGDFQFRSLYNSIQSKGSQEKWMECMRELRRTGRQEVKFMLAASFASILIQPLGGLPFFVDLWGATGGGKTVTLMVAASVWGCPEEGEYLGDYTATEVSQEVRADMLNNLPMILDDTNKVSDKVRNKQEHFESLIYKLCSGKGKSRSNRDLGLNHENRWKNAILTCGERPINNYATQGGAINRVLEMEAPDDIYEDPQAVLKVIKHNYGFGGREFVQIVKDKDIEEIKKIYQGFMQALQDDSKTQKQINSLAIVLTADKLLTDELFHDGQYLDMDQAREVLIDKNELSDNERCYQYVLGEVAINQNRFNPDNENTEVWGCIEDGYVIIFNNIFNRMCQAGGFSQKAFLSWAQKKGLLQTQGDRKTKVKKMNGSTVRCVYIKLDQNLVEDKDGFLSLNESYEQEEIPFDI